MKLRLVLSAMPLTVLMIAHPAVADDVPATTKPVKEKKICRRDETVVGSRLAPRICLTRDQWEKRDAAPAQRTMDNVQRVGGQEGARD